MRFIRQATFSSGFKKVAIQRGSLSIDSDYRRLRQPELERLSYGYLNFYRANSNSEIPLSVERALRVVRKNIEEGNTVGILRKDGEVVGGIIAKAHCNDISDEVVLQHTFYYSTLKGMSSVQAIRMAFDFLIESARCKKIKYVVAMAGTWDTEFKLCKILSLFGWSTEGYSAVYKIE